MKTPEEILQFHITEREPIISYTDYRIAALAAMEEYKEQIEKSMQEDHEKELIGFAKFIENKNVIEGNLVLHSIGYEGNLKPSNAHDLLTQFRNKQQDR